MQYCISRRRQAPGAVHQNDIYIYIYIYIRGHFGSSSNTTFFVVAMLQIEPGPNYAKQLSSRSYSPDSKAQRAMMRRYLNRIAAVRKVLSLLVKSRCYAGDDEVHQLSNIIVRWSLVGIGGTLHSNSMLSPFCCNSAS